MIFYSTNKLFGKLREFAGNLKQQKAVSIGLLPHHQLLPFPFLPGILDHKEQTMFEQCQSEDGSRPKMSSALCYSTDIVG